MQLDYAAILNTKAYLQTQNQIPTDLHKHISKLGTVKRFDFKEYPAEMISDNTQVHTVKCVHLAKMLNLTHFGDELERTLWVHDIPELITGDITAIEKSRKENLENKFNDDESMAAQQLLSVDDQKLLVQFNTANNFLKQKISNVEKIPVYSLAAKLVDNSEGNMTFHYFVTKWYAADNFSDKTTPPPDSLTHTFRTNEKFRTQLELSALKQEGEELLEIIDIVIENIRSMWKIVPKQRIPQIILPYL